MASIDDITIAAYNASGGKLTGDDLAKAVAIAGAESGFNPSAVNSDSGAAGIWQILPAAHPEYDVGRLTTDVNYNARAMWAISGGGQNWHPWEAYTNGAYEKYLKDAEKSVNTLLAAKKIGGTAAFRTSGGGLSGIGNVIGDTIGAATGVVTNPLDFFKNFVGWFTNSRNLFRLIEVIGGVILIGLGMLTIAKSTDAGKIAIDTAKKGAVVAAA